MAKKLKKLLNYWFNPENYSIIKSINGIIDTVNELIEGGGGGGGSVETLNWTKVDGSVAIPALTDIGLGDKLWAIGTNNFNIEGNHKGLMLESDYFDATWGALAEGDLAPNNSIGFSAHFTNGYSASIGNISTTTGSPLNRIRVYVVKNPITGLYQMGFQAAVESRRGSTVTDTLTPSIVSQNTNPIVLINPEMEISGLTISADIKTETGAFATQGGVTFSLYVAD